MIRLLTMPLIVSLAALLSIQPTIITIDELDPDVSENFQSFDNPHYVGIRSDNAIIIKDLVTLSSTLVFENPYATTLRMCAYY